MKDRTQFLPIDQADLKARGWESCDIILVTGDAYVDHPSFGAAIIGRVLENAGYKVGIIAQPDWRSSADFLRLGRPSLFFGITAGNLDSMVSNFTASKKPRRTDDYSPGGKDGFRPNRATLVYANKIKELFSGIPIVLGGVEASLRRFAHFDYWGEDVRRSILLDAKGDLLVYGMGEKQVLEIARHLRDGEDIKRLDNIRGTAILRNDLKGFEDAVMLPSYEEVRGNKGKFNEAFKLAYGESDPVRGRTVVQKHGERYIIQLSPPLPLPVPELDHVYSLPFVREWHPVYDKQGGIPGFETVRFSITSHRGCAGECNFCSLFSHQGRIVQSRSQKSIVDEVRLLAGRKDFRGTITDIGGPTANLYGAACEQWEHSGACRSKQCMMPVKCGNFRLGYERSLELWKEVMRVPGVKHLFIQSGLRYDLLIEKESDAYLEALCRDHVGGQLKVAPEHAADAVLKSMNKPSLKVYEQFAARFREMNRKISKDQYLVNYFVSSHPGARLEDALELAAYLAQKNIQPEQVQDFIPLPMTASTCMYYTGKDPWTGENVPVARKYHERQFQRVLAQSQQPQNRELVLQALKELGRLDLRTLLLEASWREPPAHHAVGRIKNEREKRDVSRNGISHKRKPR